jgi:hypothetical protein
LTKKQQSKDLVNISALKTMQIDIRKSELTEKMTTIEDTQAVAAAAAARLLF